MLQGIRRHLDQAFSQQLRWVIAQSAQHHVTESIDLILSRRIDLRVGIAVDHTPPTADAINQFPAII